MASATQTFKVAGLTTHGETTKVRFTDDMVRRIKQFSKGGATRVDLIELPSAMTKVEALKYLRDHADFQGEGDQATIVWALADRTPKTPKVKVAKTAKVKAVKTTKVKTKTAPVKVTLAAIKARGQKKLEAAPVVAQAEVTETPAAV
jgi:hypothetical protein